jgi:pimeloyl-ACP methyl ester carboxylesterase
MSLSPRVADDVFIHLPQKLQKPTTSTRNPQADDIKLIFFITGNPGLISYYHEFLALLANSTEGRDHYAIAGFSLGGFESEELEERDEELLFPDAVAALRSAKRRGEGMAWWGLEEQVALCVARIDQVVRHLRRDGARRVTVTLMGHSLGTWLSLEVVRTIHERREATKDPVVDESGVLGVGVIVDSSYEWEVEACMLLAPTIMDLAKSPSGVKAAPLLRWLAFLPWLLQLGAAGLTWLLSEDVLMRLVAAFMGLRQDEEGVITTTRFLRTPGSVRQALEMAKQELVEISADKWGAEVWGASHAVQTGTWNGQGGPKMYFLFAQTDHWIAPKTKDEIQRTRGRDDGMGDFAVDEKDGLVHAWCLQQNRVVSEYVLRWFETARRGGR